MAEKKENNRPEPPSQPSGFKSFWAKDHNHVILWSVVFALTLFLYVFLHFALIDDYHTNLDVNRTIDHSVKTYQLTTDPNTKLKALAHNGQIILPTELSAGTLGVGKLPSVRGLILEATSKIDDYNQALATYLVNIASQFERDLNRPSYYYITLDALGYTSDLSHDYRDAELVLGILVNEHPIEFIEGNQQGLGRLKRLIANGQVYDLNDRQSVSNQIQRPSSSAPPSVSSPLVVATIEKIKTASQMAKPALGYRKVTEISSTEVLDSFTTQVNELASNINKYFNLCGAVTSPSITEPSPSTAPEHCEGQDFHSDLAALLKTELGFFWSFGPWLWLEIIWLTILGVLTECATRLGAQYTGRDPDTKYWDPRESVRTLLKLFSAPITSVVIIWTLFYTDLIETQTNLEDGSIGAYVPLAFILGLFPNLGYALLERIAKAIFTNTSIVKPKHTNISRQVSVAPSYKTQQGEPPNFETFKRKVLEHSSAIIKK